MNFYYILTLLKFKFYIKYGIFLLFLYFGPFVLFSYVPYQLYSEIVKGILKMLEYDFV